jgi:hypothetical protein
MTEQRRFAAIVSADEVMSKRFRHVRFGFPDPVGTWQLGHKPTFRTSDLRLGMLSPH